MDFTEKIILLPLLTVLMMCPRNSLALEVYKFYEGRNVSIDFHQPLASDSSFEYELHMMYMYASCFFYKNGNMVSGCLNPQQSRRFSVHGVRTLTSFTVILSIHNINSEDSQLYLLALKEDRNGKIKFFNQDAYIEVYRPPSQAWCIIKPTEYSAAWNEVNCTSLLGSDGKGALYCFQDVKKVPYKESPVQFYGHVTWIFWMNASLPINCCSYEVTFPVAPESCSQFVFYPPTHIHDPENSRNPSNSHMTTVTAEPQTSEEMNFLQKSGEESNSATTTPHQAFTKNTLIALAMLCSLSLSLSL